MVQPLPRRLEATDDDLRRGHEAALAIAATTLGRDPGPMTTAASMSHYVYLGADIVVKLVDADGHTRLDREIAVAAQLPYGLGAPLLGHGRSRTPAGDVRFACFDRVPGTSPRPGLPGVDATTARRYAEQAVQRLDDLHHWKPVGDAEQAVRTSPVHEGFVGQAALFAGIERIARAVPVRLIEGLRAIADRAPQHLEPAVPVHADCDWGNWLTDGTDVTALLDFERIRLGEPADDWALLAVTSGPHLEVVLEAIDDDGLRDACELRDAAFIVDDLLSPPEFWTSDRLADLEGLIDGRWRS